MALSNRDIELFNANNKIVDSVVKKYNLASRDEYDDLYQEGCMGLLKAINKFQDNRNAKFSTFAYICIDNEIKMYLRRRKRFFRDVVLHLEEEFETSTTDNFNSYDIMCSDEYNPEELYCNKEELELIKNTLISLNDFDKDMLFSYYGIGGKEKVNQSELARKYKVSQGLICRRIKSIIGNMQKKMA